MYNTYFQVRTKEVFVFRVWEGARYPRSKEDLPKRKAYSGEVTRGAVKRMRKAISLIVQKTPTRKIFNPVSKSYHDFSIGFTTLTIGDQQGKSEKQVYQELLAPWLRWARRKGMKDYVWRAELQERGAVHYHLITNVFLHYQEMQDTWNRYQKKHGYLQSFGRKHGHFRPNSVDVHSVWKVGDIESYMSKYMTKDVGAVVDGKIWDASRNLKSARYYTDYLTPGNLDRLRTIAQKEKQSEHCTIFNLNKGYQSYVLDSVQKASYYKYLRSI